MKKFILALIHFYQKTEVFHKQFFKTFFMTDAICRFRPTCSVYTYQAVEKYGAFRGLLLGLRRIIRCHPWSRGGYDPLP
jgi:putative membrane protein insertion efficiency factor